MWYSSRNNAILSFLVMLATLPAASAQTYQIRQLPPLTTTGSSFGLGINDAGVVVGQGSTLSGPRAMQWVDGTPTNLGALPGFPISLAASISNNNRVVGRSGPPCGPADPTLWDAGVSEALPDVARVWVELQQINDEGVAVAIAGDSCTRPVNLGAFEWQYVPATDNWVVSSLSPLDGDPEAGAYDLNNAGVVVGTSGDTSGEARFRAVRWDGGVASLLADLGGDYSMAHGINEMGQVAGYSRTAEGVFRAYCFDGSTAIDLGTLPGYEHSAATRLNDAGTVIGHAFNGTGEASINPWVVPNPNHRAFVWRDGAMHDAFTLIPADSGWTSLNSLWDINERGQIAGYGFRDNQWRGLLLTPQCLFHGDLNDDRAISLDDLALLLSNYGCTGFVCRADVDSDGDVDLSDLATLLANFGSTCP